MIAPGIERMDTVKTANGYEMKSIWSRNEDVYKRQAKTQLTMRGPHSTITTHPMAAARVANLVSIMLLWSFQPKKFSGN